jgi:hypothetical protein
LPACGQVLPRVLVWFDVGVRRVIVLLGVMVPACTGAVTTPSSSSTPVVQSLRVAHRQFCRVLNGEVGPAVVEAADPLVSSHRISSDVDVAIGDLGPLSAVEDAQIAELAAELRSRLSEWRTARLANEEFGEPSSEALDALEAALAAVPDDLCPML